MAIVGTNLEFFYYIIIAFTVSEPEANERRQLSDFEKVLLRVLNSFLQKARNCSSRKIKGGKNYGYARISELRCAV